jgi:hypothetical protein
MIRTRVSVRNLSVAFIVISRKKYLSSPEHPRVSMGAKQLLKKTLGK